ncbi:MAG: RNA polymerase sigma factor [Oscillospiraceae bacterium]|nr:RNA polymerase sigma factor [Oscillospiraceae bacterium]
MIVYLSLIQSDADKTTFEVIYHTYKNLMFYVAQRILNNEHDAEDVVHQSFLKIIDILEKIDEPVCHKTRSLVVIIVERTALDLYRKRKRSQAVPLDEGYEGLSMPTQAENMAQEDSFARAMAALPTRQRQVLLLKYDWGYSNREIAALLSMEEANVRKTIQRAKEALAAALREQEV